MERPASHPPCGPTVPALAALTLGPLVRPARQPTAAALSRARSPVGWCTQRSVARKLGEARGHPAMVMVAAAAHPRPHYALSPIADARSPRHRSAWSGTTGQGVARGPARALAASHSLALRGTSARRPTQTRGHAACTEPARRWAARKDAVGPSAYATRPGMTARMAAATPPAAGWHAPERMPRSMREFG